jgi:hypothetical protein
MLQRHLFCNVASWTKVSFRGDKKPKLRSFSANVLWTDNLVFGIGITKLSTAIVTRRLRIAPSFLLAVAGTIGGLHSSIDCGKALVVPETATGLGARLREI